MKNLLGALLASAGLMLAVQSQAAVIGFDDLGTDGSMLSLGDYNPYQQLNWDENWFGADTSVDGYANAAHSGTGFVTNGYGEGDLSVGRDTTFNFSGAWFATSGSSATPATWINISAYDLNNQLIGSTGNVAISGNYSWVAANFGNVSRLNITRDDGWFVMDDFTLPAQVPEPATLSLMGLGVAALVLRRRRPARA